MMFLKPFSRCLVTLLLVALGVGPAFGLGPSESARTPVPYPSAVGSNLQVPTALHDCAWQDPVLTQDTTLVAGCRYHVSFQIVRPLTLNCQGAVLEGDGRRVAAVYVNSRGQVLRNVTVRNCVIEHYKGSGLTVGWAAYQDEKRRLHSPQEQRALTPSEVLLENLLVQDIDGAGLFIGDYTTDVIIDHVTLQRIAQVGIYFEEGGVGHVLKNSVLRDGGFASNQPALAIDASGPHEVFNNVFEHFSLAGVSLYRNCWEQAATNPHSMQRLQGATGNYIHDNAFTDLPVGVWVASRMSRDVRLMGCGLPDYDTDGLHRYVLDDAKRNIVRHNRFERILQHGVIVEDDDNAVTDNVFVDATQPSIAVGAPRRARMLHRPVSGTVLEGNSVQPPVPGVPLVETEDRPHLVSVPQ